MWVRLVMESVGWVGKQTLSRSCRRVCIPFKNSLSNYLWSIIPVLEPVLDAKFAAKNKKNIKLSPRLCLVF